MKILFINRVYPPQSGATGHLLQELAEALVQRGWEVTILCSGLSSPSPDNVLPASCRQAPTAVRVHRVGSLPFTRASHWRRALSYLSLYPALFFRALRLPRHDVIVTLTDPPLQLVMGPVLRVFKRAQLIHWAQDIYPEVAEELRVVRKNGLLAGLLRWLSTSALRRHHRIVAVGGCMKQRLVARGIDPGKIAVIPNWAQSEPGSTGASPEPFRAPAELPQSELGSTGVPPVGSGVPAGTSPIPQSGTRFRQSHGWGDRLVVMYSGNFGLAHPFGGMVEAVQQLEKTAPQLLFVFAGEGSQLPWMREQLQSLGNVCFLPSQPKALLADMLASADLHLAGMHDKLCGLVVPSKVYGILAAGRPCLFLGPENSEAAQTIQRHQCGAVLPESDPAALVDWLTRWAADPGRTNLPDEQRTEIARAVSLAPAVEAFDRLLRAG